jgi:uncharacterized membrane-anchored protein
MSHVATRPIGATVADWLVKPRPNGGLGWSEGGTCLTLAAGIAALVTYLGITRRDVSVERLA